MNEGNFLQHKQLQFHNLYYANLIIYTGLTDKLQQKYTNIKAVAPRNYPSCPHRATERNKTKITEIV